MKISYFPKQAALNSVPVMTAFIKSCLEQGWEVVENNMDADAAVIWSVLWAGRMRQNQAVYNHYRAQNKPVFILEVGNLRRGTTWRVSLNNINRQGEFGIGELDSTRPSKLGVSLQTQQAKGDAILIACQRQDSLQWAGQTSSWLNCTIDNIRQHSLRPIVVRPHPRFPMKINVDGDGISIEHPNQIPGTYDDFDLSYQKYRCIVNHNSGPSVQAAINGVDIICDSSSLAWPVSIGFDQIENPPIKDKSEWFLNLCHTEYTIDEIALGLPLKRLQKVLFS